MERTPEFYRETGSNAYRLGQTSFNNPYAVKSVEGKAWLEGYVNAKRRGLALFITSQIVIRHPRKER
jgi:hypothetical protein